MGVTTLSNPELKVKVGGLSLEHPVMNASGILGYLPEHADIMNSWGLSALVSKTFTKEPRAGHSPPIVVKVRYYSLLNAVGLANPGISGIGPFIERARRYGVPVVVSVGGKSYSEYVEVAEVAEGCGASAVELNLSCPNVEQGGLEVGRDPVQVLKVVKDVSSVVKIPVIVKLGISDRLVDSAAKAMEGGARALTLINTVRGMVIDLYSFKPVLSNIFGGLSGASIHPIAVWAVYSVFKEVPTDIIGVGGVITWRDAAELILAGAKAVQVGTAIVYRGPKVVKSIVKGLRLWVRKVGAKSITELSGAAHRA